MRHSYLGVVEWHCRLCRTSFLSPLVDWPEAVGRHLDDCHVHSVNAAI